MSDIDLTQTCDDLRAQLARCRAALESVAYIGVLCGKCGKTYRRCAVCKLDPHQDCTTGPIHSLGCILHHSAHGRDAGRPGEQGEK